MTTGASDRGTEVMWRVEEYSRKPERVRIVAGSATEKTALGWYWLRDGDARSRKPCRFYLNTQYCSHFLTYEEARECIIARAYRRQKLALEAAERATDELDEALALPAQEPTDD